MSLHALNDAAYLRLVAGERETIEEVIRANLGLPVHLANRLIKKRPTFQPLRDDLIATGFLALVEAVNKLVGSEPKENANLSGYLAVSIDRAILNATGLLGFSARTQDRHRRQDPEFQDPECVCPTIAPLGDEDVSYDPHSVSDLRDAIQHACEDSIDRRIVELKETGQTDAEAGETLGLTAKQVKKRLKAIYERLTNESE